MPDTLFVSPHAPFPCEGAPFGRQWFGLHGRGDALRLAGLRAASAMVDGFIDDLLEETGLAPSALTLAGFSQGTMLALHTGPRRAEPLAGILGYSGRLLAPELLEREAQSRPPVALIHGERDELVPYASMAETAAALEGAGFAVETHGGRASATASTLPACRPGWPSWRGWRGGSGATGRRLPGVSWDVMFRMRAVHMLRTVRA